jgi:RNA polymerase sigma-70 factor, ECF subfamily
MSITKLTGQNRSKSISSTLLTRVRQGQPEAWEQLVKLFGPVVYRWCRSSGLEPNDSADLLQEVFIAAARYLYRFERSDQHQGSFTAWMASITRNKIRDHFRRQAKLPQARGGTAAFVDWQQMPEPVSQLEVEAVAGRLPSRILDLVEADFEPFTWQAFWRTTVDNRRAAEVADELGMSIAAVYQAKSRVMRRLRRELEGLA